MSVAGISSSGLFNYAAQGVNNNVQQIRQEFQQLGQDLQSGNLSAAQTDFATLQQSGFSAQSNSPIAQDFKQLSQDLQSGSVPAAQQDFAKIRQDLQNRSVRGHGHHHGGGGGGGSSAINQLLEQLGQELQSGNLSSAQQSYTALQQDFLQTTANSGVFQPSSAPTLSTLSVNA
jgi:hypothetical protein